MKVEWLNSAPDYNEVNNFCFQIQTQSQIIYVRFEFPINRQFILLVLLQLGWFIDD